MGTQTSRSHPSCCQDQHGASLRKGECRTVFTTYELHLRANVSLKALFLSYTHLETLLKRIYNSFLTKMSPLFSSLHQLLSLLLSCFCWQTGCFMTPSCGMLPRVREGMSVGSVSFLGAQREKNPMMLYKIK